MLEKRIGLREIPWVVDVLGAVHVCSVTNGHNSFCLRVHGKLLGLELLVLSMANTCPLATLDLSDNKSNACGTCCQQNGCAREWTYTNSDLPWVDGWPQLTRPLQSLTLVLS